jgi:hypothetical protein
LRVKPSEGSPKISVRLEPLGGGAALDEPLRRDAAPRWQCGEFTLAPGVWRVTAHADGASPVSDLVAVAAP